MTRDRTDGPASGPYQPYAARETLRVPYRFISHKIFQKPFGKSRFPHKFVNLYFALVNEEDKLTDLWGS